MLGEIPMLPLCIALKNLRQGVSLVGIFRRLLVLMGFSHAHEWDQELKQYLHSLLLELALCQKLGSYSFHSEIYP